MRSDIDFEKNRLRAVFKAKRKELNRTFAEEIITRKFLESDAYRTAVSVLLYASLPDETDTSKIFEKALADGKNVYFPKTEKGGKMFFFKVSSPAELVRGAFGIAEPTGSVLFDGEKKSLCVVPALSFDRDGYRLGYGGGYYDRFLSDFDGVSVGLCPSFLLSESLPRDVFDIAVDAVITELAED